MREKLTNKLVGATVIIEHLVAFAPSFSPISTSSLFWIASAPLRSITSGFLLPRTMARAPVTEVGRRCWSLICTHSKPMLEVLILSSVQGTTRPSSGRYVRPLGILVAKVFTAPTTIIPHFAKRTYVFRNVIWLSAICVVKSMWIYEKSLGFKPNTSSLT